MSDKYVITISREFASMGRTIAQLMAEILHIPFYDRDIVEAAAKNLNMRVPEVSNLEEKANRYFYRSLPLGNGTSDIQDKIFEAQREVILEYTRISSCIIVGRCADYVLQDLNPFRLFVYADISSKIARCREKGADAAAMTDKELQQKIMSIDKKRARYYQFYTEQDWGNKANYDLCVNTTNTEIKKIAAIYKIIRRILTRASMRCTTESEG